MVDSSPSKTNPVGPATQERELNPDWDQSNTAFERVSNVVKTFVPPCLTRPWPDSDLCRSLHKGSTFESEQQCPFQPSGAKQRPGRLSSCVLSVLCSSWNSGQEGTFKSCPTVCLWGYSMIFLTRTPVSCPVPLRHDRKRWFLVLTFLLPWVMHKILSRPFRSPEQNGRNALIQELDPTLITFLELPERDKYEMWDMTFSQPAQ